MSKASTLSILSPRDMLLAVSKLAKPCVIVDTRVHGVRLPHAMWEMTTAGARPQSVNGHGAVEVCGLGVAQSSGAVEADRRAGIAANISQQTTIHVNGAGDPGAVAKRVADQQRQVNADLTRNFLTVVQ